MIRCFLLLLIVYSPVFTQEFCDGEYFDWQYSHLFSKLEEALENNRTTLDLLRHGFMSTEKAIIDFSIQLQVVNATDLPSCGYQEKGIFCPSNSSDYMWKLCNNSLHMTYIAQNPSISQSKCSEDIINEYVIWLTFLHGSISTYIVETPYSAMSNNNNPTNCFDTGWYEEDYISLTMNISTLKCNPSLYLTECALSELISWVSCSINC